MSYSNINEVFNINNKIEETIQGLQTNFNPTDSTYASLKLANNTLTNVPNQYEPGFESPFDNACDNNSNNSLNGTDLTNLLNKKNNEKKTIKKLTHRDCVNIYCNPNAYNDTSMNNAFKHITKCALCKEEIKKNKKRTSETHSNNVITPNSSSPQVVTQPNSGPTNVETQLKILNDKMNEDNNLKYQNMMLQNTITKYMEDIEEKKSFNSKIDKILELLNENIKTNNNLNSQLTTQLNQLNQLNQQNQINNLNGINQPNQMGMLNQLNQLNQLRQEMFTQVGSTNNSSNTNTWLIIGIVIIVLLLLIDIYLRISSNSKKDIN